MDALLVIVGDDLIMEQIRNFQPDLHQKGMMFFEHFKMMEVYLAALSRVIMILGDLHFCVSILRSIYILFYQGFHHEWVMPIMRSNNGTQSVC